MFRTDLVRRLLCTLSLLGIFPLASCAFADEIPSRGYSLGRLRLEANEQTQISIPEQSDVVIEELQLSEGARLLLPKFRSLFIRKYLSQPHSKISVINAGSGHSPMAPGASGADGEDARIFLDEVDGDVLVEARGGDGAAGRRGADGMQGADGAKGRNGRTLIFGIYIGPGEKGKPGSPGGPGEDGGPGGHGGRGGTMALYYKKKTVTSQLLVDVSGGRAGAGGRPGMGGLGGNGGPGGKGTKRGKQGAMGVPGPVGRPGKHGRPGPSGSASVYPVGEKLFECLYTLQIRLSLGDLLTNADYANCAQESEEMPGPVMLASPSPLVSLPEGAHKTSETEVLHLSAKGADGIDAPPARGEGAHGAAGGTGGSGGKIILLMNRTLKDLQIDIRGGRGGRGGDAAMGARGREVGGRGGDGGDGGDGGAAGSLTLVFLPQAQMPERNRFELAGGAGGDGGKGGDGGPSTEPPGFPGPLGRKGRFGQIGNLSSLQVLRARSYSDWIVSQFQQQTNEIFFPPASNKE